MAAPEGYNALGKIGISYKGDYDSNTTYERLDAVEHNGSTYLAIKDAPDGAPRDDKLNWIYLAKGFSGDIGDSEIAFTEAENRENINTGESVKTVFGKIKKFFADLTAPAFAQMITSKDDLLATKATGYVPDAKAVADAVSEVNGKLGNYGNDIIMGKLLSVNDNYILDLFKNAPANYSPTFGQLNIGGPIVAYIMQKHSDYYGGAVIVFGYNNFRPIYYHIVNGTINAEYYL
jgi:hypothetical protein